MANWRRPWPHGMRRKKRLRPCLDANAARQQAAANRCAERVENVLRRIQRRRANLNGARAEIARQNRAIAELERKLQNAQANRERAIYVVREMEAELEALA